MPYPTLGSVHVNSALTNVAIGHGNEEFVMGDVFPSVQVEKESDYYFEWNQGDIFRNEAAKLRPGARCPRGGFGLSSTLYTADEWGFGWAIPRRIRDNMDRVVSPEINATKRTMDKIMLAKEVAVAAVLTGTVWTGATSQAIGAAWGGGTGDPIASFDTCKTGIRGKIGRRPNVAVMSDPVFTALQRHPEVIKYIGVATDIPKVGQIGPALVTKEVLQTILGIKKILVCGAIYNSAAEGQTEVYADVLTDTVWVGYVTPTPAIDSPSAGYTFMVKTPWVRSYYEDAEDQDVVEARELYISKATSLPCGALMTNCV